MRLRQPCVLASTLLLARLLSAQTIACGNDRSGLAWRLKGAWTMDNRPVRFLTQIQRGPGLKPSTPNTAGEIIAVLNGKYYRKDCSATGQCTEECRPMQTSAAGREHEAPVAPSLFQAVLKAADRPGFRDAMSKSSVWTDSLASIDPAAHTADLAAVFAGNRPRTIQARLCPIDRNAPCTAPQRSLDWNGKTAILTGPEVTEGLFRIVEGEDETDAWVRLVAPYQLAPLQTEYRAALDTLSGWTLPADSQPAPNIERLKRLFLAGVGEAK